MPLPFNKNLDLKLIKCVQSHPLLYNAHEQKYMDFDSREVAWQQIGDTIKRPGKDINSIILYECVFLLKSKEVQS